MKIKKLFASVLGATLAMGLCFSPISAKAAEKTYKGSELVTAPTEKQMGEIVFETAGDAVKVTIPSQWNQALFEIPAEVLAAGLESAKFDLADAPDNIITIKFVGYKEKTPIGIIVSYNTPGSLVVDEANIDPYGGGATAEDLGLIEYIDFMNGITDPVTFTVNSVVFTTTNEIAAAEAPAEEPAPEAPAEEPAAEDTTATLPKTGLVSGTAFLVLGAAMMLGGAVVTKKED